MKKLMLVDGSNLLFQMFYGMPSRIVNRDGKAIQGTLGFVGALLKMIRMIKPTHLAVFFDGECANPRQELDGAYKSNRVDYSQMPEEDTPFSQLPDIFKALEYLKIPYRETECCEADDWIASYAIGNADDCQITIVSQDSDFFQLINHWVQVLRYRGKQSIFCDPAYIQEKLGIIPQRYAFYKALTGDGADHIPGVPHVGPKTAADLVNRFGDLETLLSNTALIPKPSVRHAVEQNAERIRLNAMLITLKGNQAFPFSLDELEFSDTGLTTMEVLSAIGL